MLNKIIYLIEGCKIKRKDVKVCFDQVMWFRLSMKNDMKIGKSI